MTLAILALAVAPWLQRIVRESNSAVETRRGVAAYEQKDLDAAQRAFAVAHSLETSPDTSFNLGTARLASGDLQKGSQELDLAVRTPKSRAAALYNRGTAALAAKQYDRAVADLVDSLRADPKQPDAKRNLELALKERQKQQDPAKSGAAGQSGGQQAPQPQPGDRPAQTPPQQQTPQQASNEQQRRTDALLRSVEQQEREELRRMRAAGQERRAVGW